jgi:AcrR family transcriptional regulator
MAAGVNPRRRYDSPRRREQAAATRAKILEVAHQLFVEQGYAATTMAAVAAEAGVSLKTVYLVFATKSGLLRALWDTLLRGESDIPVAAQPWYRQVIDQRDPERRLRLNARNSRAVKARIGRLLKVIRDAAPTDPDAQALWTLIETDFYDNQRQIVVALHRDKALRRGLDVTRATDLLWTLNHPEVWHLLVDERGWTHDWYERWLADTTCAQLLKG